MKTPMHAWRPFVRLVPLVAGLLFVTAHITQAAEQVLMVVGNPDNLTASDSGIIARLEASGLRVVVMDDGASTTADADNKALVIVSSTVSSGNVSAKFRDVAIPVINWEQAVQDDFWMTYNEATDHETAGGQTDLVITAEGAGHPLGGGLSAGVHTVVTAPQSFAWGRPNYDVQAPYCTVIATLNDGDPTHVCIYGYDAGNALLNGDGSFPPAPARRVETFLTDNTFAVLNAEGMQLFDAAVGWALDRTLVVSPASISITSPVDGESFNRGTPINIVAAVDNPGGTIQRVEFYANGAKIGESLTAPYSLSWADAEVGFQELVAKVVDDLDRIVASAPITITVGTPPPQILLVVGNPAGLGAGDIGVIERLEAYGMQVIVMDDGASATADADGKDLVIVSSTVASGDVGDKFRDVLVPVINWEQALQDNFWMTYNLATDHAEATGQTSVVITTEGAAHPLGAGLSAGVHEVVTSSQTFCWGYPNYDASEPYCKVIATLDDGDPTHVCIYGYDVGDALLNADGSFPPAPARRVHIFLTDVAFSALNDAGLQLFDAAVGWAMNTTLEPSTATISISGPADGSTFTTGSAIEITTTVADPSGPIRRVEFFASGVLIGESSSAPYSFTWADAPIGYHVIVAKVVDEKGRVVASEAVTVTVGEPPPEILLVVGTSSVPNLNASDTAILARIEAAGYSVRSIADSASTTADADNAVMVIVSSTITSGNVSTKFRDVAIPVMNWEHAVADDFGFCGNAGTDHNTLGGQTDLEIVDPSHPLAAGLSGTVTIVNAPDTFSWALPLDSAIKIAQVPGDPTKYPLFAFETGALMMGDVPAPARRVFLPMGDTTYENMTADGLELFDAALSWALEGVELPPPSFDPPVRGAGTMTISWSGSGTLEQSDSLLGPWSNAPDQTNGQTVPTTGTTARFYRVKQ